MSNASSTVEDDLGVSPFPHPPKLFYKLYTDENVKDGKSPLPPKPIQGTYKMFGAQFDTHDVMIRKLHEQDIKQLYPDSHDRKVELRKLNRSIIVCFLELLDILILNPSSPARSKKIMDLSYLFINIHHIINEFRPHQARETLKVIMERQRKQREDIVGQITRNMEEVHSILKECKELMVQACSTVPASLQIASCDSESSVTDGGVISGVTSGGENVDITLRPETADKSEMNSSKHVLTEDSFSLIDKEDAELCAAINSFLQST